MQNLLGSPIKRPPADEAQTDEQSQIESALIAEIRYFEALATSRLSHPATDPASAGHCDGTGQYPAAEANGLYEGFIRRRRQLLAALRAGQPEAWKRYSPE